jgi:hypothetical protein
MTGFVIEKPVLVNKNPKNVSFFIYQWLEAILVVTSQRVLVLWASHTSMQFFPALCRMTIKNQFFSCTRV